MFSGSGFKRTGQDYGCQSITWLLLAMRNIVGLFFCWPGGGEWNHLLLLSAPGWQLPSGWLGSTQAVDCGALGGYVWLGGCVRWRWKSRWHFSHFADFRKSLCYITYIFSPLWIWKKELIKCREQFALHYWKSEMYIYQAAFQEWKFKCFLTYLVSLQTNVSWLFWDLCTAALNLSLY